MQQHALPLVNHAHARGGVAPPPVGAQHLHHLAVQRHCAGRRARRRRGGHRCRLACAAGKPARRGPRQLRVGVGAARADLARCGRTEVCACAQTCASRAAPSAKKARHERQPRAANSGPQLRLALKPARARAGRACASAQQPRRRARRAAAQRHAASPLNRGRCERRTRHTGAPSAPRRWRSACGSARRRRHASCGPQRRGAPQAACPSARAGTAGTPAPRPRPPTAQRPAAQPPSRGGERRAAFLAVPDAGRTGRRASRRRCLKPRTLPAPRRVARARARCSAAHAASRGAEAHRAALSAPLLR